MRDMDFELVSIVSFIASLITLIAFAIAIFQIYNSKKLIKIQAEIIILSTTILALISKNTIRTEKDAKLLSKSVEEIINLSIKLGEEEITKKIKEIMEVKDE